MRTPDLVSWVGLHFKPACPSIRCGRSWPRGTFVLGVGLKGELSEGF